MKSPLNARERFNGALGERLQPARDPKSGKSSVIGARPIHCNFTRKHEGPDGTTPAQAAGIEMGGNVLEFPIRSAAMRE